MTQREYLDFLRVLEKQKTYGAEEAKEYAWTEALHREVLADTEKKIKNGAESR